MKRPFLGIIICISILAACSKSEPQHSYKNPYDIYKSLIIGNWSWRWYLLYDSIYGSTPYNYLMQHTGGTYRFTSDSMFKTEIDTSWITVGGQTQTDLDSSSTAFDYTISNDSLFARNATDGIDTFIINVDSTSLSLTLKKYVPGRYFQTQTNCKR